MERLSIAGIDKRIAICKMFVAAMSYLVYRKSQYYGKDKTLHAFLLFDVAIFLSSAIIPYGYRMSYPFLAHYIIYLPRLQAYAKEKTRLQSALIMIGVFAIYWIVRYVICGYDGVII